jgi:hypothetical protein
MYCKSVAMVVPLLSRFHATTGKIDASNAKSCVASGTGVDGAPGETFPKRDSDGAMKGRVTRPPLIGGLEEYDTCYVVGS